MKFNVISIHGVIERSNNNRCCNIDKTISYSLVVVNADDKLSKVELRKLMSRTTTKLQESALNSQAMAIASNARDDVITAVSLTRRDSFSKTIIS